MAFLRDVSSGLANDQSERSPGFWIDGWGKRGIQIEEKAFKPENCWFLFCYLKESQPEDKDVTQN